MRVAALWRHPIKAHGVAPLAAVTPQAVGIRATEIDGGSVGAGDPLGCLR